MATKVIPKTQRVVSVRPTSFVLNLVYYDSVNGSEFDIDATANTAVVVGDTGSTSNAPTIANSTVTGMKTVTIPSDASGTSGDVWVITRHPGDIASSKA